MHHPTDGIAQTTVFVTPVVEHYAGTRNCSMGSAHEGSTRRPIAPWANALTTELHLAPREKGLLRSMSRGAQVSKPRKPPRRATKGSSKSISVGGGGGGRGFAPRPLDPPPGLCGPWSSAFFQPLYLPGTLSYSHAWYIYIYIYIYI